MVTADCQGCRKQIEETLIVEETLTVEETLIVEETTLSGTECFPFARICNIVAETVSFSRSENCF